MSTRIEPERTYQRSVPIGEADVVHFQTASAEQIVSLKIVPQTDDELVCRFYAPSGEFRRAFSTKLRANPTFTFFAAEPGDWRLEVSSPEPATGHAHYVLSDFRFHPLALAQAKPGEFESPRLGAIHTPADVAAFWNEMKTVGTPLIETIPGEPDERLVTFVWRGSPKAKSIFFVSNWDIENRFLSPLRDTGIWYLSVRMDRRVRAIYRFAPNLPRLSQPANFGEAIQALGQRDPLNPKAYGLHCCSIPLRLLPAERNPDDPLHLGSSVIEMPDAPPQPWIISHPDTPKGNVSARLFDSKVLGNSRTIWIYTPAAFQRGGKPYPLIVLPDGGARATGMDTPTALDNLIAARRIPPVLAVMIPNISNDTRFPELGDGRAFTEFLTTELVPWVRKQYNATADPHETIIAGVSLSGFAAVYGALLHPETFGNVISQSGSLYFKPLSVRGKDEKIDNKADQSWLMQQFIKSPVLPIRFYLEAGSMERDFSGDGMSLLLLARRMRDVLRARGYSVLYSEYHGAHDDIVWRETFAEALIRLFDPSR